MQETWEEKESGRTKCTDVLMQARWAEGDAQVVDRSIRKAAHAHIEKEYPGDNEGERAKRLARIEERLESTCEKINTYVHNRMIAPFFDPKKADMDKLAEQLARNRSLLIHNLEDAYFRPASNPWDGSTNMDPVTASDNPTVQAFMDQLDAIVSKYLPPHKKTQGRSNV